MILLSIFLAGLPIPENIKSLILLKSKVVFAKLRYIWFVTNYHILALC